MSRPLSKNQAALVAVVEQIFAETRAPVPFAKLLALSGVPSRFMTSAVASLIDRGAIFVPVVGVPAYLPASVKPAIAPTQDNA